jgi:hypothetical protein
MPRTALPWRDLPLSDEAAAATADVLMQVALEFEATYLAQIRHHYHSMRPEPKGDPRQLELFPELSSFPFHSQSEF